MEPTGRIAEESGARLIYETKKNATVEAILNAIKDAFVQCLSMPLLQFHEKFVGSKKEELGQIDLRTDRFFKMILGCVNQRIETQFPHFDQYFARMDLCVEKIGSRNAFVEGMALDATRQLIQELDAVDPNIVENVTATVDH